VVSFAPAEVLGEEVYVDGVEYSQATGDAGFGEGGGPKGVQRIYDWGRLVLCNMIWGSQFVVWKIVQRQAGPVFAALFPITIATLLLIPVLHRERREAATADGSPAPWKDIPQFVLIGLFGQALAQLFVAWGVRFTLVFRSGWWSYPLACDAARRCARLCEAGLASSAVPSRSAEIADEA
jgi:hypothetical protein